MQLYMTDKAIEFNSEYEKLQRVLDALKEAHMDVSSERKKALDLKNEVDHDALHAISTVGIEKAYDKGLKGLSEISDSLKKHEVYYNAYTSAGDIETKISGQDVSQDQLKSFADITISLLKKINASDTRVFQSEETIVDKVYDVAYSIIKLELLTSGTSEVLTWVKSDSVASNLIDTRIFEDIAKVPKDSTVYGQIRTMLADINVGRVTNANDVNSGLNYTALNESFILFLALQDSGNVQKIQNYLLETINDILENEKEAKRQKHENIDHQTNADIFKEKIKESRFYKQIALGLGLIAILVGIKQGSDALAKTFGHDEFRTRVDYYSSEQGELPEYPEFMKKIDDYSQTTLKAYGTWNRENVFYGDYERYVVVFDLSGIDLDNLDDYASIDFSHLTPTSKTIETSEELDPSMLYDDAIIEITRLIQDPNDTVFVPNEKAQNIFITVISVIECIVASVGLGFLLDKMFKNIAETFASGKLRKQELKFLKEGLEKYKMLTEKNEEFKKRFLESYQKYSSIISDSNIKEQCESLLKRIKNE